MKINLKKIKLNPSFHVRESELSGKLVYLVYPAITRYSFWTSENLIFRSSLWDEGGNLISASFPKFFNLGERPDLCSLPTSYDNATVIEKLDGSALIVSRYRDMVIRRTRRRLDASQHPNGDELGLLSLDPVDIEEGFSYIFEWLSPKNIIVIRTTEPLFRLIGVMNHEDYSLKSQLELDILANRMGVERPKNCTGQFSSFPEIISHLATVKYIEGYCIYFDNDQKILKVKSDWYLEQHQIKFSVTDRSIRELFIEHGFPKKAQFEDILQDKYDFESLEKALTYSNEILENYRKACIHIEKVKLRAQEYATITKEAERARQIIANFADPFEREIAFRTVKSQPVSLLNFPKHTITKLLQGERNYEGIH